MDYASSDIRKSDNALNWILYLKNMNVRVQKLVVNLDELSDHWGTSVEVLR